MSKADDEFYWRVRLDPRDTGLPMAVRVERSGDARAGIRLKVEIAPGRKEATIAVCPVPHVVDGYLPAADMRAVSQWIQLNLIVVLDYWDGTISAAELLRRLQRLSP